MVDGDARAALAAAMVGDGNRARVLDAPTTAVFLADTQPARRLEDLLARERAAGASPRYLRSLAFDIPALLAGGADALWRLPSALKRAALNVVLPNLGRVAAAASPTGSERAGGASLPTVDEPTAWAYKSTMPAVQTYVLGCAAHDIATHVMEGLNADAVRRAVGIHGSDEACRFAVPCVVATGYVPADGGKPPRSVRVTSRPPLSSVVRHNIVATAWREPMA